MFCKKCGEELKGNVKFCGVCGNSILEDTSLKAKSEISENTSNGLVGKMKHNKKKIIVVGVILAFVIFIALSLLTGNKVSESRIKENLAGTIIIVESVKIETTEDTVKGVSIDSEEKSNVDGIKKYKAIGTAKFETKNYTASVPLTVEYIKYKGAKEWILNSIVFDEDSPKVVLELKEKLTAESVKKYLLNEKINGIVIDEELINSINIESLELSKNGTYAICTGELVYKGAIVEKSTKISAEFIFDGVVWNTSNVTVASYEDGSESKMNLITTTGEIDGQKALEDLKMIIGDENFKPLLGKRNYVFNTSNITELTDVKIEEMTGDGKTNIVTSNFKATKSGVDMDGFIKISINNVGKTYNASSEVTLKSLTTSELTEDEIKELLTNRRITGEDNKIMYQHVISDSEKATFKLDEMLDTRDLFSDRHVFGTITYTENGKKITDTITIDLLLNSNEIGEYEWIPQGIYSKTMTNYYGFSKEAVKERYNK